MKLAKLTYAANKIIATTTSHPAAPKKLPSQTAAKRSDQKLTTCADGNVNTSQVLGRTDHAHHHGAERHRDERCCRVSAYEPGGDYSSTHHDSGKWTDPASAERRPHV
ncbi:hypothetical protein QF046_001440 [Microbacterium sp. W4I4]|uniref:hypothetical protein n=1 Tax=Microbacterium sp. W4I4 TaxID=3042295 RepID=UPI002784DBEF|nr:hypothetical protein [Microbacterium sp. W4I4]MDQ0613799.1 hypothetical protein [Microbacterium sp. W4I4]